MRQYRSSNSYKPYASGSSPVTKNLWKYWLLILVVGVGLWWLFINKSSSDNTSALSGVNIKPVGTGSEVILIASNGKNTPVTELTPLGINIDKITVKKWEWLLSTQNKIFTLTVNANGEMRYKWIVWSGSIEWITGDGWLESQSPIIISMRNIFLKTQSGSILLISQNARASNVYVVKGAAMIKVKDSSTTLNAGKYITILNGELESANLSLPDKIAPFDDRIKQDSFFIKHGGLAIIDKLWIDTPSSGWILKGSGSAQSLRNSGSLLSAWGKFIEISTPRDEETMTSLKFDIAWKLLDPIVTRVTINDRDASLSPVEKTFLYKDFSVTNEITNITFKAYDVEKNLLEKWVVTVYMDRNKVTQNVRPTVTTYPISDKNFRIVAPKENPYKTTEDIIQIQGTVPANLVKSISVNGFQLTKFKPYSTTWYYFANKEYKTLAEWINEYTIQYYDADGKILSTGKFIIVKESKQVINPEENTPLFPEW